MRAPKRFINIELLLGISATFLSLAALVVSIFQTKIARDQQQASVWPYLQLISSNVDQELHFGFENKGVGPAIIKNYEILYRGKTYTSTRSLFYEEIGVQTAGGKGFSDVLKGDVFKSGEDIELLFVAKNDTIVQKTSALLADSSLRVRIRYADVYGNCWLLDRHKTTSLGNCPD